MLERARTFNADIVIIDLEDSVPGAEKINARDLANQWVPVLHSEGQKVMVRVNSLDTGFTRDELETVISPHLYGVSIGKVESSWDLREVDRILASLEVAAGLEVGRIKLIPWIESARSVMDAYQIATASSRVLAIAFGAEDYTQDIGVQRTDVGEEVRFPRAMVAVAARAARVDSLDTPFVRFRDPNGLRLDAREARQLGYTGKFATHPDQLDIINETFSPSTEEVEYAEQVVSAWEHAEASGRGSLDLNGRMIDVPVVKRARNLLALAQVMGKKS
jgi:citrate lyase subunit beta/citryl-CoA lyase